MLLDGPLLFMLSGAGHVPTELVTSATVAIDKEGAGFVIKSIALDLQARVPGITEQQFLSLAEGAKKDCPVSKALAAVEITLKATLLTEFRNGKRERGLARSRSVMDIFELIIALLLTGAALTVLAQRMGPPTRHCWRWPAQVWRWFPARQRWCSTPSWR